VVLIALAAEPRPEGVMPGRVWIVAATAVALLAPVESGSLGGSPPVTVASAASAATSVSAPETATGILDRRRRLEDTIRHWETRYQRLSVRERDGIALEVEVCDRRPAPRERWTIAFLLRPADKRGQGFISKIAPDRPTLRYFYIPWQRRVRQAPSAASVPSFFGSDLDAHDLELLAEMESWTAEDVDASRRGDETVAGVPAYVIEMVPRRADPTYRRIVAWLGMDDLIPRRVDLYTEGSPPRRRIIQADVRLEGTVPMPHRIDVETPAADTHTTITVDEVAFGGRRDRFEQIDLERGSCR
jgi:Outer membrane lipoprotein-sorting protein